MSLFRITCLYTLHSRPEFLESNTVRNLKVISKTDQKVLLSLEIRHKILSLCSPFPVYFQFFFIPHQFQFSSSPCKVRLQLQVHFHLLSSPLPVVLHPFSSMLWHIKNSWKITKKFISVIFLYSDMMR